MKRPRLSITIDTREQDSTFWRFEGVDSVHRMLEHGDYAVTGYEAELQVERKTVADFVQSMTVSHDREFGKVEAARAAGVPRPYLVEGTLAECLEVEVLRTKHPHTVEGAIRSLLSRGVGVAFCGSRERAEALCLDILRLAWRHGRERAGEIVGALNQTKVAVP